MKLSVVVPAYNEENAIGCVVKSVPRQIEGVDDIKILVVDDGSTDRTFEVAKQAGADRIIQHETNRGVGEAFQTGLKEALTSGADIIVTMDGDGQFDPEDIPRLVQPILERRADFVVGSRFLSKDLQPTLPFWKLLGNRFFTKIVSWAVGEKLTDTQCGFRAYSRETALRLTLFGSYTYTQEVLIDLLRKKQRILEVPVKASYDERRRSRVVRSCAYYGLHAGSIVLRTIRDSRPLAFFGTIGSSLFLTGVVLGLFVFLRWIVVGATSPYTSLINVSSILLTIGFLTAVLGLLADMHARQRKLEEEILYHFRKRLFNEESSKVIDKETTH